MGIKKALITGITGQDGSYLCELLLEKGYEVHGIIRRSSSFNTGRIDHLFRDSHDEGVCLFLHYGDLTDGSGLNRLLAKIEPDEIYHLGAQSNVKVSFEMPEYTGNVNALGTLRLLDAIKDVGLNTKFYNASSSELYGLVQETPQTENTPFCPRSPYAVAKLYAHWTTINYREGYNLFACNGILFNHESPRRGKRFVSRKITDAAARIKLGLQNRLYLGNLNAKRDWGYAGDYVKAMWMMLQQPVADDYVIATGEAHSVREFCDMAFSLAGIGLEWEKEGMDEKGMSRADGRVLVEVDPRYLRPTEVPMLEGDAGKAKKVLGWEPEMRFKSLVEVMVKHSMEEESMSQERQVT